MISLVSSRALVIGVVCQPGVPDLIIYFLKEKKPLLLLFLPGTVGLPRPAEIVSGEQTSSG
ncbi:MAG: hypothetical protein CMJ81_07915 [Planctomycetaceae bacterium]|nr:hypothetical protein [Planctomycetaceae bacterium]MBP63283.1 hypothetical protein [Planctomycetaceae bacterium]